MPPELAAAVRSEAARIRAIDDPAAAIRAVGDTFAGLDLELEALAAVRLEAVGVLRDQGWSYDRIAAATGLSKGRVAQLARAAQTEGRADR